MNDPQDLIEPWKPLQRHYKDVIGGYVRKVWWRRWLGL